MCKSRRSMKIMREIALFSGKIYTAGTNITRLLVVTVATNLNSGFTFGTNIIRDVNIAVAAAPSLPFSSTLVTIVKVDCETRRRT